MPRINREYNKPLKAIGNKVVIKKLEKVHERKYGDLYLPDKEDINQRMTKGEVISIGPNAINQGFKEGDIVLYDTLSVYQDFHPIVVTKAENIILIFKDKETGLKFV